MESAHTEPLPAEGWEQKVPNLPTDWNTSKDVYCFRYRHSQSAMTFLLKCLPMANKFIIHALAIEVSISLSVKGAGGLVSLMIAVLHAMMVGVLSCDSIVRLLCGTDFNRDIRSLVRTPREGRKTVRTEPG